MTLQIGPNLTITPRHRDVTLAVFSSTFGFVVFSVDKPGLSILSPLRVSANVMAQVDADVVNANTVYTVTVSNTATAESDSCTVTVESLYTAIDLSTIEATIKTCMNRIAPTENERQKFTYEDLSNDEYSLTSLTPRHYYIVLDGVQQGMNTNILSYTFSIIVGYDRSVINSDMVLIQNALNNYDWPAGVIGAWCESIVQTKLTQDQPGAVATLQFEVFS